MRYLLIILLFVSCRKEVQTLPPIDVENRFEQLRPGLVLRSQVQGNQVSLSWKKQGNQTFSLKRNGVVIFNCSCGSFTETLPNGTYTYQVNSSNVVTVIIGSSQGIIVLDFDGHLVSGTSWNYFGDFYATPALLSQWEKDSIVSKFRHAFKDYNVEIRTEGQGGARVVFTEYWEWYAQAGGTAFLSSFGTENGVCFVFTALLFNHEQEAFAGVHEAGHTLGLYHAVDYCGQGYGQGSNYMAGNYNWPFYSRNWENVLIDNCGTQNQPEVIRQTL